jgi:hypothetical protein
MAFVMIPTEVLSADISNSTFRVYAALASFADNVTRQCWPTIAAISERSGISDKIVRKALRELREAGFMNVQTRTGHTPIYTLTIPLVPEESAVMEDEPESEDLTLSDDTPDEPRGDLVVIHPAPAATPPQKFHPSPELPPLPESSTPGRFGGGTPGRKGGGTPPQKFHPNYTQGTRPRELDSYAPRGADFDLFWERYPRKRGKAAATRAWQKAILSVTAETITDALLHQIESGMFPEEVKFIPYPATWLNQQRWEDEAEVSQADQEAMEFARMSRAAFMEVVNEPQ